MSRGAEALPEDKGRGQRTIKSEHNASFVLMNNEDENEAWSDHRHLSALCSMDYQCHSHTLTGRERERVTENVNCLLATCFTIKLIKLAE